MHDKKKTKVFEVIDIGLPICPICKQEVVFGYHKKARQFIVRHHPTGICPARSEDFCANESEGMPAGAEFARKLWRAEDGW